ncbi:rho GTPase-activating protein 1 [Benincasa hispida]|uniref:rho GTPase-activating protein 1 n=1 Tax=Benincasa hispida TaxID=102211 RepID=UPI001900C795|nr:rho GTPase-activating protein 1 [Benincasa hispida]XP_038902711.1 rho GTPase-activating protein 1 [Benincasa hispida]
MTEVVLHSPSHFASSRRRVSSSSSSSTVTVTCPTPPNDGSLPVNMHPQTPTSPSSSSSSVDGDGDVTVIECEVEEEVGKDRFKQRRDQLSLLALVVTLFRKSLIACKSDRRELCAMEIGWPTNVRHVTHVTFDRFNGFLGLPVEFEPEVPHRAPSASTTVFGVSTESMQLSYDSRGNSVPTILILMQHCLYAQGGLQAEGIFRINAENSQEEYVRDQLNQGVVPDDIDVHCLAGLIKAWFRELPAGILDSLSPEEVMECQTEEECTDLIRHLPPSEASLLDWAINLMADVVQQEHFNKMNARNIAMVFAPNMTQMADPLTALMYAVQVMNFLRMLILRTLRGREDSILDSAATHLEPPDESGHQSPSQPCLGNTGTVFQVAEQTVPEFFAEPPVLEMYSDCIEGPDFSDGDVFSLSHVKKLLPNRYGDFLNAHEDKEAVAGNDMNAEVVIQTDKNRTDLSNVQNLKKETNKLNNQNSVFQVLAPVPVEKRLGNLSCINSWTERIEAWR